jgi:hypothetical protein
MIWDKSYKVYGERIYHTQSWQRKSTGVIMGSLRTRQFIRYTPEEIEEFCKELTWNNFRRDWVYLPVSNKYDVEVGLLMICKAGGSIWASFKEAYRANTDSGHYLTYIEYQPLKDKEK